MSTLDAIWAISASAGLTDSEKADAVAQLKASEWSAISVPLTVGTITISEVYAHGDVVELQGTGGVVDWPLQLVNAPIAVPDNLGPDFDMYGQGWRIDCPTILQSVLETFQ